MPVTTKAANEAATMHETAQALINLSLAPGPNEYDWEGIARAGFTDEKVIRAVGVIIQMGAHLIEGTVLDETVLECIRVTTPSLAEILRERLAA